MGFNSYQGVNIPFTADNRKFIAAMTEARGSVGALQASMSVGLTNSFTQMDYMQRRLQSGLGRTADALKNFGTAMTTYWTLPIALGAAGGMKAYFDLDAMAKGLDVITGSTQKTSNYMKQFLQDAAMPGLGFKEVAQHGGSWLILGDNIQTARKKMQEFGNALALEGKGKEVFANINYQLIQMANKGKVVAEDLKPIITQSSVIAKAISDRYGTTDSSDIQKQLEKQGVGSKAFINQLVQDLSKLDRVIGGAKNSWENFTDSLFIGAAAIGEFIDKGMGFQGIMDSVGNGLRSMAKWLTDMPLAWKQVISTWLLATVVAGPLIAVLGTLIKTFSGFMLLGQVTTLLKGAYAAIVPFMMANPIIAGLAGVALGFAAAATVVKLFGKEADRAAESQQRLANVMADAKANAGVEVSTLTELAKVAKDKGNSDEVRAKAIKKLNDYAPEYLGNITLENIGTAESSKQISKYIVFLEKKILYEAAATDFSVKQQQALKLAEMGKNPEAGFFDYAVSFLGGAAGNYGNASAKDIAKARIAREGDTARKDMVDSLRNLRKYQRDMEGSMNGLTYTPLGGAGAGGTSRPGKLKTELELLQEETKKTIALLDDLEREMSKFDKDNGLDYLKNRSFNPLNPTGFDAWAGKNTGVKASGGFTKEGISAWMDGKIGQIKPAEIKKNLADIGSIYAQGLSDIAHGITTGFEVMTQAWVEGTFKWQSVGVYFSSMLGNLMSSMGDSFVTLGIGKLAAQIALSTGLGGGALIAIGAGLKVAGGAMKGQSNNWAKGGQLGGNTGSVGSYSSPTYSGTNSGYGGSANQPLKIDLNISGLFKVSGSDLVLAISRQTTVNANR